MKKYAVLIGLIFVVCFTYAQDKVISEGRTIDCKIYKVTKDTLFIKIEVNSKYAKTFIPLAQVTSYEFYYENWIEENKDSTVMFQIVLADKRKFLGNILNANNRGIEFEVANLGSINIKYDNIYKIEKVENVVEKDGQFWIPNPNSTRYLFAPSAYNLKKGEGYYQNVYVLLNSVNYGITDYFSIGGGIEFISTFSGYPIAFITPKFGFHITEKFGIGMGVIAASFDGEYGGIAYGVFTYGGIENNVTLGVGWGAIYDNYITIYNPDPWDVMNKPIITVNGMMRVGPKAALVTENWFAPIGSDDSYMGIVTYGVRFFKDKFTIDLALVNNMEIIEIIPIGIPYVDFVFKF